MQSEFTPTHQRVRSLTNDVTPQQQLLNLKLHIDNQQQLLLRHSARLQEQQALRRARAETFSAVPQHAAKDPRQRSGSLNLPSIPFSTFGNTWDNSNFTSPQLTPLNDHDEISSVSRTLDYLGLDDDFTQQDFAQKANVDRLRNRSYSVAVGEIAALKIQIPWGDGRPRATSIGLMELNHSTSIANSAGIASAERSGVNSASINPQLYYEKSKLGISVEPSSPSSVIDNEEHNKPQTPHLPSALSALLPQSPLPQPDVHPTRSLWIGNIDPTLSAADLLTLFSPFGTIESLRILPDKECAFVNYCTVEEAVKAREEMQGSRIGRCVVKVGFGKVDEGGVGPTKSLWVGNIPPTTNPADLESLFSQFGQIESARVLTHKNCGFVNFVNVDCAIEAKKQMNGRSLFGSIVKIGFAKVPDDPSISAKNSPMPNIQPAQPDSDELEVVEDTYYSTVASMPESRRKIEQNRLREMRKRLEGHVSAKEFESILVECLDECVDLCVDYIGNVIIQKLIEKSNDAQRQMLIERIAPYLSVIGIHKNGTWAAQKIIDCARTPLHIQTIVTHLQPYTPPLLLDQFGNYVVQCCLRLTSYNQFIFDAMHTKCFEIAQGRFGSRAMRACLESPYTTKRQQKHVSISIVKNAVALSVNTNGCLLIGWLLDMSGLSGRYRVLAPKLRMQISVLAVNKLASGVILKIINQNLELDARELLLKEIFFSDETSATLREILSDTYTGVPLILKILTMPSTSAEEKQLFAERVKIVLGGMTGVSGVGYKRLMDEVNGVKGYDYMGYNGYTTPYYNGYAPTGYDEEYVRMMMLENGVGV